MFFFFRCFVFNRRCGTKDDTDNGAYYYYNPIPNETYMETLWRVHKYAERVGIPYKHVLLDSWWYIKGAGNGVKEWSPDNNTFPNGVDELRKRTGWRITAHNRMWATDTVYARQNGGDYDFLLPGKSSGDLGAQASVPTEQRFWDDIMGNRSSWLTVYEQDWLFTELHEGARMQADATLPRTWLLQMGRAAAKYNIVVQYCMLWPRFAMQSLELAAVTTARGSTDYHAGADDWMMGMPSMFLDALGLRPTKDNYFTTDKQGNGKKGVEPYNRLHALASTLSRGPVFPSDAIHCSDVALIMRHCDANGRLLRPARAATNLDNNMLDKAKAVAVGAGISQLPGERMTTFTNASGAPAVYFLAVNTKAQETLTFAELTAAEEIFYDRTTMTTPVSSLIGFESNSTNSVITLDPSHPITLPATDKWSFAFYTFVPRLSNGWACVGEADSKWMALSSDRFTRVAATSGSSLSSPSSALPSSTFGAGIVVELRGVAGEKVRIGFVAPNVSAINYIECVVPASEYLAVTMPDASCSAL